MDKNFLIIAVLGFLLLPKLVSADMITPLSFMTIPLIPVIILIEAFFFWLLMNRLFNVQTGFWRVILVVLVANIVTSLLGTIIPLYRYTAENLIWVGVAFIASIFIEWGLYIPFFRRSKIKILDLLKISLIVNLTTYIPIFLFIAF